MSEILQTNINLAAYTTYRIGGTARYFAQPQNEKQIIDIYKFASDKDLPVYILGAGSNVLISDNGINGVVLRFSSNFSNIEIKDNIVKAKAGTLLTFLINSAKKHGLGGMEKLTGIPGTIGGGVVMNAGAFNLSISKYLKEVTLFDVNKETIDKKSPDNLGFAYRTSNLQNSNKVVLEAVFELHEKDIDSIQQEIDSIREQRKQKQQIKRPNAGSVFRNPPGNSPAGKLLDELQVKGMRVGDAMVSDQHANFIVNLRNAKAQDVYTLIKKLQDLVYENYNVKLEPEIKFMGEF